MKCPKCGHEQPDGSLDCGRCGIVFARYRLPAAASPAADRPAPFAAAPVDPPVPEEAAEHPARPGGWEPAVVGGALAAPLAGTGRGLSAPASQQLYGGPRGLLEPAGPAVERAGRMQQGGDGEVEVRHELTGRLYEGPLPEGPEGDAASAGMALRPAPARDARKAGFTAVSRFTYGAVIRDTFSIFGANLLPFLLIAGVTVVPLGVAGVLAAAAGRGGSRLVLLALGLAGLIELVLAGPLVTGAITFGVAQEMRHREASVGDCLRRAFSSVLAILGVAFLQSLVILGGFLLCIVPGLIASVFLCVAVPAALEERRGVMAALQSSADLTRGHRWEVAGVLLTFGILQVLLGRLVSLGAPGGGPPMGHGLPAMAAGAVGTALQATAAAVMYYRLRSMAEGVEVAALPSIFD